MLFNAVNSPHPTVFSQALPSLHWTVLTRQEFFLALGLQTASLPGDSLAAVSVVQKGICWEKNLPVLVSLPHLPSNCFLHLFFKQTPRRRRHAIFNLRICRNAHKHACPFALFPLPIVFSDPTIQSYYIASRLFDLPFKMGFTLPATEEENYSFKSLKERRVSPGFILKRPPKLASNSNFLYVFSFQEAEECLGGKRCSQIFCF